MYFDVVINILGKGVEVVISSPKADNTLSLLSYNLNLLTTWKSMRLVSWFRKHPRNTSTKLKIYCDSMLIIYEVKGDCKTKYEKLNLYKEYLTKLVYEFGEIKFTHLNQDKI